MQKINVAIIGWGNVGRGCKRALSETKDMRLVGVVRRPVSLYKNKEELQDTNVVSDITELNESLADRGQVSRLVLQEQRYLLYGHGVLLYFVGSSNRRIV